MGLAAGGVVLGWHERTDSLLIVALFHAGLNLASATRGSEAAAPAIAGGVIVAAIVLVRRDVADPDTRSDHTHDP